MTSPYCGECESRSESRENVSSKSTASEIVETSANRKSDFAGVRGKVETEQDCCKPVFFG